MGQSNSGEEKLTNYVERLAVADPKEKISISVNESYVRVLKKVAKKYYKNAPISRIINMLIQDFLEFHHIKELREEQS